MDPLHMGLDDAIKQNIIPGISGRRPAKKFRKKKNGDGVKSEGTPKTVGERVRSRRQERLEARRKGLVKSGRMSMPVDSGKKEKKAPIRGKRGGAFAKKDISVVSANEPSKVSFLSKAVRDALGKKIKKKEKIMKIVKKDVVVKAKTGPMKPEEIQIVSGRGGRTIVVRGAPGSRGARGARGGRRGMRGVGLRGARGVRGTMDMD
eukprot:TRINITY_DN570_c1_g2_i1.p1 TRINITY_DN570_c1_g2~~TRINITY_DN570_c1_g2_i1.p1  ORF type:complete len:205 (-),score=75.03 TRINITY_DN570_c1_g2_i1:68-682(-)